MAAPRVVRRGREARLHPLEVRQAVGVVPRRHPGVGRPALVVERVAALEDLAVDARRAAEDLAAGVVDPPAVHERLGLGLVPPVVEPAADRERQRGRHVDEDVEPLVRPARLEDEDPRRRIGADSRLASAHPAEPPPTMMKSYASPPCAAMLAARSVACDDVAPPEARSRGSSSVTDLDYGLRCAHLRLLRNADRLGDRDPAPVSGGRSIAHESTRPTTSCSSTTPVRGAAEAGPVPALPGDPRRAALREVAPALRHRGRRRRGGGFGGFGRRLAGVPRLHGGARAAPERFRLGVITNCDDDLFAALEPRGSASTSTGSSPPSQVGSYKPDRAQLRGRLRAARAAARADPPRRPEPVPRPRPGQAARLHDRLDRPPPRPPGLAGRRRRQMRRPTRRSPTWRLRGGGDRAVGPRPRGPYEPAVRATRTGIGALRTTCSDTLPITSRSMPRRPCVPTTIRSTDSAIAASTMASPGSPSQMRNRIATCSRCPRSMIGLAAASRDRTCLRAADTHAGQPLRPGSMTLDEQDVTAKAAGEVECEVLRPG